VVAEYAIPIGELRPAIEWCAPEIWEVPSSRPRRDIRHDDEKECAKPARQFIRPNRAALVLAILMGSWHLLWTVLVAVGWAQSLIDFILWIHFIRPVYVVEKFNVGIALLLIGVTAAIGYVIGWCFAVLWNKLHQ
jgi:hypothetical protein